MFFWATLEKNIPFVFNFIFAILVARMVSPEAYGLVAMTAMLTALGTAIQNMGFSAALVQRRELLEDDLTTAFLVNLVVGFLVAAVMVVFSESIARFFGHEELETVVYVNAAALVFAALGTVQMAMLQRDYQFRTGLIIETLVSTLSGGVALLLAWLGHDLSALLAMILIREGARSIFLWLLIGWRPQGRFNTKSLSTLWSFARHMLGASLYHHFASNLSSLLLGKFYPTAVLGLYSRAVSLQALPVGLIAHPFQRVAFPLYSRNQNRHSEIRRLLRGHVRSAALLAGFVTAGLVTCANEFVLALLGESWGGAGPMLQIIGLAALCNVISPLHSEASKAIGASRWFFWAEMSKKTALVILLSISFQFGVTWLLWALVISSALDYIIGATATVRFINYSWVSQIFDFGPSLTLTLIAICLVEFFALFLPELGVFSGLVVKGWTVLATFACGFLLIGNRAFPELHVRAMQFVHRVSRRNMHL